MTFTITPDPEEQHFDIRVKSRNGRIESHAATTADVLEWLRRLVVDCDCSITVSTDLIPSATPEPRYLFLGEIEGDAA